jgi:hypothetical protein
MTEGYPWFVQFPHPGGEHRPSGELMEWNERPHGRKFLVTTGSCRQSPTGRDKHDQLTFWGEWEPPSRIIDQHIGAQPGSPRFLHEPLGSSASSLSCPQNTDPLVLGEEFLYSNCRQVRNAKMRNLPIGSVVLFGSRLSRRFVVDTVFVVARAIGYRVADAADVISEFPELAKFVVRPLHLRDPEYDDFDFCLYVGATPEQPVNSTFSFVPCRPLSHDEWGFPRPCVHIDGLVNENLAMQAKTSELDRRSAREKWRQVVAQITDQGCSLGHGLALPSEDAPRRSSRGDSHRGRKGC